MITGNINLGKGVKIDTSSNVNNVLIGDNVKIASEVKLFGSEQYQLELGENSYIGPYCFIEGFNAKVIIGKHVSFAQRITLMSGSGPNASHLLQRIFPEKSAPVQIDDHSWIGAHAVIMPGVRLGKFCVVAANSFVNTSFPDYSVIGGTPAKLIRKLTAKEINQLND